MQALITYLLSAMFAWSPPAQHDYYAPRSETTERYAAIARDAAEVALDPNEAPLFGGPQGRPQTALFMTSIAFYESGGYRRDVDLGIGKRARGDGGNSWCLMQLNIGSGKTTEGWSGPELVAERQKCLRAGLHRIRESFDMCRGLKLVDRLSGYTKGRCTADEDLAHRRIGRAMSWWTDHKFDEEISVERAQAMAP